jgi:putative membrane protein
MWWGQWPWMFVFFWGFFWIALIVGLVFLIKWIVTQGRSGAAPKEDEALEILKVRYAKGEINKEEFEQKKRDILSR